jgi:hypothetical protein
VSSRSLGAVKYEWGRLEGREVSGGAYVMNDIGDIYVMKGWGLCLDVVW